MIPHIPDPGNQPVPAATTPASPDGPTMLDRITAVLDHPALIAATAAAGFLLVAGVLIALAVRRRKPTTQAHGHRLDKALTFFAAAVATGVVGTGMWVFFGDTLHVTNPILRGLLFAMFEIGMLAEALRSRLFRLDRAATEAAEQQRRNTPPDTADTEQPPREIDVDGIAVWVLALISGTLAASHEHTAGAVALRLIAPIVAAWLWERGLAGELRQYTMRRTGRPNPVRVLGERLLVSLGLAEPSGMSMGERAQARRLNQLARARFRVHVLKTANANRVSLGWAQYRLRRRFMAAVNQLDLAGNPALRASLQQRIAVLMAAESGTAPEALAHLNPWAPQPESESDSPTRTGESRPQVIDSTATGSTSDSGPNRPNPAPNPNRSPARIGHRSTASNRTEPAQPNPTPARIGGDEAEMVSTIRPFVADFRRRNGKAPGQQVTRTELARFGFRVGTRRAGELADLADSANLSADSKPAAVHHSTADSGSESATDSTDSESAADSKERTA